MLQALRDVRVPVDAAAGFFSHHLPLALKQLIAFYLDCTNTRNMLDSALTELALSRGADAQQTSSEKLLVLLTELRALRLDAARLRLGLRVPQGDAPGALIAGGVVLSPPTRPGDVWRVGLVGG